MAAVGCSTNPASRTNSKIWQLTNLSERENVSRGNYCWSICATSAFVRSMMISTSWMRHIRLCCYNKRSLFSNYPSLPRGSCGRSTLAQRGQKLSSLGTPGGFFRSFSRNPLSFPCISAKIRPITHVFNTCRPPWLGADGVPRLFGSTFMKPTRRKFLKTTAATAAAVSAMSLDAKT